MLDKFKSKLYSLSLSNKFLFFSIAIIILVVVLLIYNNKNTRNSFIKELNSLGYYNTDNSYLYYKNVSDTTLEEFNYNVSSKIDSNYEVNYFDIDEFLLKKNKRVYYDSMLSNLNLVYNYKKKKVTYSYRVEDVGEATLIYSGNYEFKDGSFNFTCDKDYIYEFELDGSKELVCDKLSYDVKLFYDEALDLFDSYSLLYRAIKS